MKTGVILMNIGTPESPEPEPVGRYLSEFLMDPYVVDIARIWRWILVKILIVPRRKFKSSEAYKKIWRPEGSPLRFFSEDLAKKVGVQLGESFVVREVMRYSRPRIGDVIKEMKAQNVEKIIAVPMYPQFADSSSTSCLDELKNQLSTQGLTWPVTQVPAFYNRNEFLLPVAKLAQATLSDKNCDHYLFSYHGLPMRHLKRLHPEHCFATPNCCDRITAANENCYRAQATATTQRLVSELKLKPGQWTMSFQSRLGRTKWIEPYTDVVLHELAAKGVRRLAVVCPSFVADCLETLEEIGIRARDDFRRAGGEELFLVPCLNANDDWAKGLSQILKSYSPA